MIEVAHATKDDRQAEAARPRLGRAERRDQILAAATSAFASRGFAATSLDDVAVAAGISKVLLYRHFESKADLYRAVLDRAALRLAATAGTEDFDDSSIAGVAEAASEDPDGFRLLFRYAAREPEFRDVTDALSSAAIEVAAEQLSALIPDPGWAGWASRLIPTVVVEGVIAWLDSGQPHPDQVADRIARTVGGIIDAAQQPPGPA